MIPRTRMTIDMYLKQAGIGTAANRYSKPTMADSRTAGASFGDHLQAAASDQIRSSGSIQRGATLADYRRQPHVNAAPAFYNRSTIDSNGALVTGQGPPQPLPMETDASVKEQTAVAPSPVGAVEERADPPARQPETELSLQRSIRRAAYKYNLPDKLIASVIRAESNFQSDAVSAAGAQGLMQLMPATARELGVTDPFDVQQNIDGGAKYLRRMLDRFNGDLKLALAAYNAGPGTVARYDGDVPFRETREYIKRVMQGMGQSEPA